jgi:hypothetical protein
MASSTGSSRRSPHRLPEPGGRTRWRVSGALALGAVFLATAVSAALPDYLREALGRFSAEVPPGWTYTQTTVRGDESTTERYDPSRPPAMQWTLLLHNGGPPTADELGKYARFKAGSAPPVTLAPFQKADIDPGSVELGREDTERAEFACGFRAESTGSDKMLGHLQLHLIVHKQPAWVEKFTLELRAPYSPVLGVKMNTLAVQMSFSAPGPDRPSLPAVSTSLFSGRIFFVLTEENLRVTYAEFARAEPAK